MSSLRLALRALQVCDEALVGGPVVRELLIAAEDALGAELGLDCTGVADGGGYSHNAGTCPIHEWLEESDHLLAHCEDPPGSA